MIEYFLVARRHGGRAAAGAPVRRRPASRRARADELLGLQLDRLLRARRALRRRADSATRSTSSRRMVKTLHSAGIEVILDVVYNHTGEGNHLGPTLSLRGIDNRAYYRLEPSNPRFYTDFTGTGNSLNMQHPRTIQLDHGFAALLGERHARRRLPLRPRAGARARAARRRQAVGVLRHHPSGSRRWPT